VIRKATFTKTFEEEAASKGVVGLKNEERAIGKEVVVAKAL